MHANMSVQINRYFETPKTNARKSSKQVENKRKYTNQIEKDIYEPSKIRKILNREAEPRKSGEEIAKIRDEGTITISKEKLAVYKRGQKMLPAGVKTAFYKKKVHNIEAINTYSVKQAARTEMLLTESSGFLEPDEGEETFDVTQAQLRDSVDITSQTKSFQLTLTETGPYTFDYSRNGRNLLLGGSQGHVAAVDWVTKELTCELNLDQDVKAVKWLNTEQMFAVAQKEWTYMYDNQGVEIHCLKKLYRVACMEYLPYHFLLNTASDNGFLTWLDISVGQIVANYPAKQGRLDVMCLNPQNATTALGHAKGTVTLWSPNSREPLVKMLCHKTPVRAIAIDPKGLFMASASVDRSLKIWDLRNYKCLQSYVVGTGVRSIAFSQKEMLAVSLGTTVEVYKNCCSERTTKPYMRHRVNKTVGKLQFCPYEDVLGVGKMDGFSSMLIPGSGEANFDSLECNPYQTKSQRREAEVKALLEKIQPHMITLDPKQIGAVDVPTLKDKIEGQKKLLFVRPSQIDFEPKKSIGSSKKAKAKKALKDSVRREFVKDQINQTIEKKTDQPEEKVKRHVLDRFLPKVKSNLISKL